jgi:predicted dehydrogenase
MKLGLIGYGYWGPNLLRNFAETPGVSVARCVDQRPERCELVRRRYPGVQVSSRAADIFEDAAITAVVIATPVSTHYPLAKQALEAGKHVLVEKPLTRTVAEAEELVELARKKGRVLMVDHVFVYSPPVVKMKEIVDSGRLGKLFFVDSVRINLGLFQHDVNVVWDLAPHDLSIVDYLLNRSPRSVSAFGSVHAGNELEDVAYLTLDFGDGLIASIHVNWLSPVKIRHMMVCGSEQSLLYNDLDASERVKVYNRGINVTSDEARRQLLISYRSGDVWSPQISMEEPLSRMARHFAACVKDGQTPITDGQAGLRVVRILNAAQQSIKAQGGRIVL